MGEPSCIIVAQCKEKNIFLWRERMILYEYGKLDDIVWCSRSYITITLFAELLKSVLFIWELEEKFIVLGLSLKLTNKEFKL